MLGNEVGKYTRLYDAHGQVCLRCGFLTMEARLTFLPGA